MIQVGFSTGHSAASALIRGMTRSKASHAWLLLSEEHAYVGVPLVLEATAKGVVLVPFQSFLHENRIVALLPAPWDLQPGVQWALGQLGRGYDYAGLLENARLVVGRWLKQKWTNPLSTPHQLFCSELVVRALQASSTNCPLDPESTSPQQLWTWLLTEGGS